MPTWPCACSRWMWQKVLIHSWSSCDSSTATICFLSLLKSAPVEPGVVAVLEVDQGMDDWGTGDGLRPLLPDILEGGEGLVLSRLLDRPAWWRTAFGSASE